MAGSEVKNFSCPKCGAAITVNGIGQTNTFVCSSCLSALDLEDPEYKVLYSAFTKKKPRLIIPLGAKGKLRGDMWQMIGYMQRSDGSGAYIWEEYLLFNPYKGFRWLTQSQGHWSFVNTIKATPKPNIFGSGVVVLSESFKHFLSGTAKVNYVIGEFYWRVKVDSRADVEDYVHPPRILSKEATKEEVTWSIGEYIEANLVQQAFKIKEMPLQSGVAPNQPNKAKALNSNILFSAMIFFIFLTGVQMYFSETAENIKVYDSQSVPNAMDDKGVIVTQPFELTGRTSNLQIKAHAPVQNNWIYLNYILFNQTTGQQWVAGREISYYQGYDDGYWTEGSTNDQMIFPSIPAGMYVLTVEREGFGMGYSIAAIRNVPYWGNYWFAVLIIGSWPLLLLIGQTWMETQRWSESDHPYFETEE